MKTYDFAIVFSPCICCVCTFWNFAIVFFKKIKWNVQYYYRNWISFGKLRTTIKSALDIVKLCRLNGWRKRALFIVPLDVINYVCANGVRLSCTLDNRLQIQNKNMHATQIDKQLKCVCVQSYIIRWGWKCIWRFNKFACGNWDWERISSQQHIACYFVNVSLFSYLRTGCGSVEVLWFFAAPARNFNHFRMKNDEFQII